MVLLGQQRIANRARERNVNDPASVNVPYRCAPESDLSSAKAVRVNRDTWSRGNFVFHLLQVIHRPDSKDCFFRCLRMIARFSQSTR